LPFFVSTSKASPFFLAYLRSARTNWSLFILGVPCRPDNLEQKCF
jgi:hypothetical protein